MKSQARPRMLLVPILATLAAVTAGVAMRSDAATRPAAVADPTLRGYLEPRGADSPIVLQSGRDSALAWANLNGTIGELEARATKGDYQAQRNLAYRLSHGDAAVAKNSMEGCAWRLVILLSGDKRVDDTDVANKQLDCDQLLSATERVAAVSKAEWIAKQIAGSR